MGSIVGTISSMGISKAIAWSALSFFFIATLTCAAEKRFWKQGTLASVEVMAVAAPDKVVRRYECVVSDGTYFYTMEYEHPIKAAVHDPVRFVIEKDQFVLLDADGKERPARIEKRERVLIDPPKNRPS
jgi:hypothetical protein